MKMRMGVPLLWADSKPETLILGSVVVPTAKAVFIDQAVEFPKGFATLLPSKIFSIENKCDSVSAIAHPINVGFF